MGPWQIVWIILMAISLGANMADHGKTRVKTDNFWTALISYVIVNGILYAGGFFG
jgi:hypothetical protein